MQVVRCFTNDYFTNDGPPSLIKGEAGLPLRGLGSNPKVFFRDDTLEGSGIRALLDDHRNPEAFRNRSISLHEPTHCEELA